MTLCFTYDFTKQQTEEKKNWVMIDFQGSFTSQRDMDSKIFLSKNLFVIQREKNYLVVPTSLIKWNKQTLFFKVTSFYIYFFLIIIYACINFKYQGMNCDSERFFFENFFYSNCLFINGYSYKNRFWYSFWIKVKCNRNFGQNITLLFVTFKVP